MRALRGRDSAHVERIIDRLALRSRDFESFQLTPRELCRPLERFLGGEVPFDEFAPWVRQLRQLYASSAYWESLDYQPALENTLNLLALCTDRTLARDEEQCQRLLRPIHHALRRGRILPAERVLRRLYSGLKPLHLEVVERGTGEPLDEHAEPTQAIQWFEIALPDPDGNRTALADRGRPRSTDPWIALSVNTLRFWTAEAPTGAYVHPENDKMLALRDSDPDHPLLRTRARYYVDYSGRAEIVLDTDSLGIPQLEKAVGLFCLRNGVRRCELNANQVYFEREEP